MTSNLNEKASAHSKASLPGGKAKTPDQTMRVRAAKALSNARQRCYNKNDPSYPDYGGSGIRVLIDSVDELIAAIGMPKAGHSLDRIDPNAHYQIGNVRWATKSVQAANKKASSTNSHLSPAAMILAAKEALALRTNRKEVAVSWRWMIDAFNTGHLRIDRAERMAKYLRCSGVIEANFDVNTVHDWSLPAPGYLHLPALSLPEARVRIRCRPPVHIPASNQVDALGRLAGLDTLEADWNVPPSVWKEIVSTVTKRGAGIALTGVPTVENLLGGWIEGSLLAAASCLAIDLKVPAAFYPLLRVNHMLCDLPAPDHWDEYEHRLLDTPVLLIPDLSLDCGLWGDGNSIKWWKIEALFRWRYEQGHQTVVGVQNLKKLHPALREVVLGAYRIMAMPKTVPHVREDMLHVVAHYPVPESSTTLREMAVIKGLADLVNHWGLVGT